MERNSAQRDSARVARCAWCDGELPPVLAQGDVPGYCGAQCAARAIARLNELRRTEQRGPAGDWRDNSAPGAYSTRR